MVFVASFTLVKACQVSRLDKGNSDLRSNGDRHNHLVKCRSCKSGGGTAAEQPDIELLSAHS